MEEFYYRIEYNEKQNWFHNADKHDNFAPAKAPGWVFISEVISNTEAGLFYDMVDIVYPKRSERDLKKIRRLYRAFTMLIKAIKE